MKYLVSIYSPEEDFHDSAYTISADTEEEAALEFCETYFYSDSLYELGSPFIVWVVEKLEGDNRAALYRRFEIEVDSKPVFYTAEVRS